MRKTDGKGTPLRTLATVVSDAEAEVAAQARQQALDALRVTNAVGAAAMAAMAVGQDRAAFLQACERGWDATAQATEALGERLEKQIRAQLAAGAE